MNDQPTIDTLLDQLHDPAANLRASAAHALGKSGDPRAVAALIAAIERETDITQWAVIVALGYTADPRAYDPLVRLMSSDDANIRSAAATALGKLHDPRSIPALQVALHDRDWQVGMSALTALVAVLELSAKAKALIDFDTIGFISRAHVATELGALGETRAIPLLEALLGDFNEQVVVSAARSLQQVGYPDLITRLLDMLDNGTCPHQHHALQALRVVGEASLAGRVVPYLEHETREVREAAVSLLAEWGVLVQVIQGLSRADQERLVPLVATYQLERRPQGQLWRDALRAIGGQAALDGFLEAVGRFFIFPQPHTVALLLDLLGAEPRPRLLALLDHEQSLVRKLAVAAMGQVGDGGMVPRLLSILDNDPDQIVQAEVPKALVQVGGAAVLPDLLQRLHDTARWTAAPVHDDSPFPDLLGRAGLVLPAIMQALGALGDARAVDTLLGALDDPALLPHAVEALGRIGHQRALPHLQALWATIAQRDEETLAVALAHLGDAAGLAYLVRALAELQRRERLLAILHEIGTPQALAEVERWQHEHEETDHD